MKDPNLYLNLPVDSVGFIFIGPSGAGKSTLRDALCDADLEERFVKYLPYTTRPQRPGEADEYRFITKAQAEEIKKADTLLFGNFSYGNYFLTTWPETLPAEKYYTYIYLPEAAVQLKAQFPNYKIVQILPADTKILKQRIITRDPDISRSELSLRLDSAEQEIATGKAIADAFIINDNTITSGVEQLNEILSNWIW